MNISEFKNVDLKNVLENAHKNSDLFITICDEAKNDSNSNSELNGIPYAISDNFSTKDILSTGGSATLSNYVPIFNATVIDKLNNSGAINIGKLVISEFEITDSESTAKSVSKHIVPFAIGTDSNGQLRLNADKNNVIGYKPTYGLISRFGMFAVASAFDTVGIIANSVTDIAIVANAIKGLDINDMNTWDSSDMDLTKNINTNTDSLKIAYIKELSNEDFINKIKTLGTNLNEVSLDSKLANAIKLVHTTITNAEMTTTLANLTGIPFGPCGKGNNADEMMFNYRSVFTEDTKKRLVKGCYTLSINNLDKFYFNALRIRKLIFDAINSIFGEYDAIILPTDERSLLLTNLGGYPSITIRNGISIMGKQRNDAIILNVANNLDEKGGE